MSDPLEIRTESERKSMRPTRRNSLLIFLLVTTVAVCATLKSISTIDLPGPAGKRFDYLTIDYDDHYLLSAHLAAGLLYVIDLRSNQVVKARRQHDRRDRPETDESDQEATYGGQAGWQSVRRSFS